MHKNYIRFYKLINFHINQKYNCQNISQIKYNYKTLILRFKLKAIVFLKYMF